MGNHQNNRRRWPLDPEARRYENITDQPLWARLGVVALILGLFAVWTIGVAALCAVVRHWAGW
jgi:hypothetical protein